MSSRDTGSNPILEVDDVIVALMGAPTRVTNLKGRIEGITRLEKMVFLFEHESPLKVDLKESADFRSHNFGPFSSKVYRAIDTLVAAGMITDSQKASDTVDDAWEEANVIGNDVPDPYATRDFELTPLGVEYYQALLAELPPGFEGQLSAFKHQFATLPLRQLVRYVYRRYPEFTDKSLIREEILGR